MIPNTGITQEEFDSYLERIEKKRYGSKDFKVVNNRIVGTVNDVDELAQTIRLILSTERFRYITMSENIGVELWELYGKQKDLIELELKSTITDAIMTDDRVEDVVNFDIKKGSKRGIFEIKLDVVSGLGETLNVSEEVSVIDE